MRKIISYLSPFSHLGEKEYPLLFPLLVNIGLCLLSEVFALFILKNPAIVGIYIIFLNAISVIYFSLRSGAMGGYIASLIAVIYYIYIMYNRNYTGNQITAGITTTLELGIIFFSIALIIGWLRQMVDSYIDKVIVEKERLKTILNQLPVGIAIADSKGKITQTNERLYIITGTTIPAGLDVGKEMKMMVEENGKVLEPHEGPLAQVISTGNSVINKELSFMHPDGKNVYIKVSAAPIHNGKGEMIAAASIISDITRQKEIENRKDDFVNMASHELKTPITSMKLNIEILTKKLLKYDDESSKKILINIKNQTVKLQDLVSDLLDVSRLQTGKLSFSKEEFRIDSLMGETIDTLQATTDRHKINYANKMPVTVYADKFRIYQVLTNLLGNAIKFSSSDTDINVNIRRDDGKAFIQVQDFGMGIAKDQYEKIFERLYQVTDSKKNTFPGLGMGLFISKEIVREHGGEMWVESEMGKGSIFSFSIPAVK